MAGSLNKVQIIGRLGQDPEVKYTQNGQAVTSFSMATDEGYTHDGKKVEKTEWHRIVAWGKIAETCGNYLSKGSLVYVEGKLQTRQWEDKSGNKHYTTEIIAFTMQFMENKGDNQGQTPPQDSQNKGHNQQQGGNSTNTSKGTAGMDNTPF